MSIVVNELIAFSEIWLFFLVVMWHVGVAVMPRRLVIMNRLGGTKSMSGGRVVAFSMAYLLGSRLLECKVSYDECINVGCIGQWHHGDCGQHFCCLHSVLHAAKYWIFGLLMSCNSWKLLP